MARQRCRAVEPDGSDTQSRFYAHIAHSGLAHGARPAASTTPVLRSPAPDLLARGFPIPDRARPHPGRARPGRVSRAAISTQRPETPIAAAVNQNPVSRPDRLTQPRRSPAAVRGWPGRPGPWRPPGPRWRRPGPRRGDFRGRRPRPAPRRRRADRRRRRRSR